MRRFVNYNYFTFTLSVITFFFVKSNFQFLPSILCSATCRDHKSEIIVVDGGSKDLTARTARREGATVISAPKGRASQLRAGAAKARGDILLFLHADSKLPKNWELHVQQAMTPKTRKFTVKTKEGPPLPHRGQWGCFETITIDVRR